jgi:1-acyl-sn-glycerol-3-phosphate acyltransferase
VRAWWRLPALIAHLLTGLWRVRFVLPAMSEPARQATIRRWSRRLLALLDVQVKPVGEASAAHARVMLAINHVSWLDIFALLAHLPITFVAKSEIRRWPLIGSLAAGVGTLFIERGRSRHARETNGRIAALIDGGGQIGVFPEGTTSPGDRLLPFHAALFQPVIDAAGVVQPVALRYLEGDRPTQAAAYVDDLSLVGSVWRILNTRHLRVELRFGEPIEAGGQSRRSLAVATESVIASALSVPLPHRAHRTPSGPRDALP